MTERGSATVLMVGVVGVVIMLALALGAVARLVAADAAAQAAADLAALAAAAAAVSPVGGPPPCVRAAEVVAANGARLEACRVLGGGHVLVEVGRAGAVAAAAAGPG